ncbi:hypothetical protein C9439_06740 [archaeon SCG-AAA382B04]|nr:hypothetical protein C9439_06740 [archaeon SCG-AAA382B04]
MEFKMKRKKARKWDKRYSKGDHTAESPTNLLKKWHDKIKKGKALDIACGAGKNSLYLAKKGFDVDATDISKKALEIASKRSNKKDLDVNWIKDDFEKTKLPCRYYDLVISTNFYLKRDIPRIEKAIKNKGWFFYKHHLDIENFNIIKGPPKKYRFKPNEIKEDLKNMEIHYYQEIRSSGTSTPIFELVARKE